MKTITLIGAGQVATHLGRGFATAGYSLKQVYSRNIYRAKILANVVQAEAIDDWDDLSPDADLYIVSVSDTAIAEVAEKFPFPDKLVAHTAGGVNMEVLKPTGNRYGIFYPLQTFSLTKPVDMRLVPFCIEGCDEETTKALEQVARQLSNSVHLIDSTQRHLLHIGAVFACNFTNHLYAIADELLKRDGLSFDMLRPLISETAAKAQANFPETVQTGPAFRGDDDILATHMAALTNSPEYQNLYKLLSDSVQLKRDETKL
jgi:predicted short-subunit dehydrogenase-like oxidoreductase (DUF2520 family)